MSPQTTEQHDEETAAGIKFTSFTLACDAFLTGLQATEQHDGEAAERNRELTGLQALNAALNRDLKAAEEECKQQEADAAALREQLAGSLETHVRFVDLAVLV